MSEILNITPNPRILLAITNNPISPENALCELIDNSIDAFTVAKEKGMDISDPWIKISLPKKVDVNNGVGRLVIEDNGPGLSPEYAKYAVTAGFSGNNPFDRLGLFGMGFNISTGKLGCKTIFSTCRKIDKQVYSITIDIPAIIESRQFEVPGDYKSKISPDQSGASIEIRDWWPKGKQNYGFVQKLAAKSKPNLREQIGRRYSTWLRKGLRIFVNDEPCPVFNHCVWDSKRFVMRKKHGKINAKFNLNHSFGNEKRCMECWSYIEPDQSSCGNCGESDKIKTKERSIKGWVGIQRYDSKDHFGIDLIRNGRVIRVLEKEAFFTWVDDKGSPVVDYPIDNPYGRIIGEIHMDHVPVDFLKTDFERTSPEWAEAVKFLRGETSLQPERGKLDGVENESPIYKLYQGYRKVRVAGTRDLYMGYWNTESNGPKRISRVIEDEYIEKFKMNSPGYGPKHDEEWFKLVEAADIKPIEGQKECDVCGMQNPESNESCHACGKIFIGKKCISCEQEIAKSSFVCLHCNADQYGTENMPWICSYCSYKRNRPDSNICRKCNKPRGSVDIFELDNLKENSNLRDDLSNDNMSIPLPEGGNMPSMKLFVYDLISPFKLERDNIRIPVCVKHSSTEIHIFIDSDHPAFNAYQDRPEDYISMEIAKWAGEINARHINDKNRPFWSISSLYWATHSSLWKERVELSNQETFNKIDDFFSDLKEELPHLLRNEGEEIYEDLDRQGQSLIMQNMINNNVDISNISKMKEDGEYLEYLPENLIVDIFKRYPEKFLDGNY